MNLKEDILYNTTCGMLNEMSQAHIDSDVIDLILQKNYKEAAQKYIDNHKGGKLAGSVALITAKLKRGEFAKTLKADKEKIKQISKEDWKNFEDAYAIEVGVSNQETRSYKKTKGTIDQETGDVKTSASVSQKSNLEKIRKLEENLLSMAKTLKRKLDTPNLDDKTKKDIENHIEGLEILFQALQFTKKGRPVLPPETEEDLKKLEQRYKKIGKTFLEKKPVVSDEDDDERPKFASDEEVKNSLDAAFEKSTGIAITAESIWKKWLKEKKEKDTGLKVEHLNYGQTMLAEGLGYKGLHFKTNYVMSSLTRGFVKDVEQMGLESTKEIYTEVFGEETLPIFEYMAENIEILNESVKVKGWLLFEEIGELNVQESLNYLTEAGRLFPAGASKNIQDAMASARTFRPKVDIGSGSSYTGAAMDVGAGMPAVARNKEFMKFMKKTGIQETPKSGLLGVLKGLWDRVKEFGKGIATKLGALVGAGFNWAKNIAKQGISWIANNPIAKIAVPAVAIAGGITAGIALINKLRKKAGKRALQKEEEEELKRVAKEKELEIRKAGATIEV